MTNYFTKLVILTLLAVGSSFIYFLNFYSDSDENLETQEIISTDYTIKNAKLFGTDMKGRFLYKIIAKEAKINSTNKQIYLTGVNIKYDTHQNIDWVITAEKGQILSSSNVLALNGNVILENLTRESNEAMPFLLLPELNVSFTNAMLEKTKLTTEYLEVNPNTYTVTTNRNVFINKDDITIQAQGLTAHIKENELQWERL
jgi:LPS export ABC transporter protein LptC